MAAVNHSVVDQVRDFVAENPFGSIVGLWGAVLTGTFAYLYRRPIPLQLKIIQGRIVAQGALLTGAGIAAGYHFLGESKKEVLPKGHTRQWTYKSYEKTDEHHAAQADAAGSEDKAKMA